MTLYVDLDTLKLIQASNDKRGVSRVDIKRGDALPLTVRFVRDGSIIRLDATTTINFAIKESGKYDDDPLVLNSSFTASAVGSPDDDPNYTAEVDLNTTELNAVFFINSDPDDDPASVDLMGELTWQATGDSGPTSIQTFNVRCANDVYRGDEGTPTSLDTPSDWLDDQLLARGLEPVRSGATTLYPANLTPGGSILDDGGDPIALSDLGNLTITGDQVEGTAEWDVTLADTGTLTLSRNGSAWEFVYSGPSTASDVTLSVTSDKADPTGLTLTGSGNTVTLTDAAGLNAPSLGDIGWISGAEVWYRWDGEAWEKTLDDAVRLTGTQTVAGDKTWSGLQRMTGQNDPPATSDEAITRDSGDSRYLAEMLTSRFQLSDAATAATGTAAVVRANNYASFTPGGNGDEAGLRFGRYIAAGAGSGGSTRFSNSFEVGFKLSRVMDQDSVLRLTVGGKSTFDTTSIGVLSNSNPGVQAEIQNTAASGYECRINFSNGTTTTLGSWVSFPTLASQDLRWVRLVCDGTNIKIFSSEFDFSTGTFTDEGEQHTLAVSTVDMSPTYSASAHSGVISFENTSGATFSPTILDPYLSYKY